MPFESVKRVHAHQQVAQQIREAIHTGELQPGEPLPPERELVELFNVGRTTLREALRLLQAQGLLHRVSATAPLQVAHWFRVDATESVLAALAALAGDPVPLQDLLDLRLALETWVVRHATKPAVNSHALAEARAALDAMGREGLSLAEFSEAHADFHSALLAASGNKALQAILIAVRDKLFQHMLEVSHGVPDGTSQGEMFAAEHRRHAAILDAMEAGDGDRAARLLKEHLAAWKNHAGVSAAVREYLQSP